MTTAVLDALARLGVALLAPFTRPLLRIGMAMVISLAVAIPGGFVAHSAGGWLLGALGRGLWWLVMLGWRLLAWTMAWVHYLQRALLIFGLSIAIAFVLFAHLIAEEEALLDHTIHVARTSGAALWALARDRAWLDVCAWPMAPRVLCDKKEDEELVMVRDWEPSPEPPPRPWRVREEDEEWLRTVETLRRKRD
jgi:hypothetical protein